MNEMTQTSRHRIRNSSLGGLMPCSPQYFFLRVDGEETFFVSFKPPRQGNEPGNEPGIGVKGSGANRYPRAPAHLYRQEHY